MHLCLAPDGATGPEVQKIASRLFLLLRNKKIYPNAPVPSPWGATGPEVQKIALRLFFAAPQQKTNYPDGAVARRWRGKRNE